MSYFTLILAHPYAVWLIALTELIIGLYVLVLNAWHTAHRHTAALILVIAANGFAMGSLMAATTTQAAYVPGFVLIATTLAIEPLLLFTTIALLKPEWLSARTKWIWWPIYALAFLPSILLLIDNLLATNIFLAGIDIGRYSGDLSIAEMFFQAITSSTIRTMYFVVINLLTIALVFSSAISTRKTPKANRKLAWMILAVILLDIFLQTVVSQVIGRAAVSLLTGSLLALAFAYACYTQMVSERRMQRGSLQSRLTALTLVVPVPVMVIIAILMTSWAGQMSGGNDLILFQAVALLTIAIGSGLLLVLSRLTIRHAVQPVHTLIDTANAIATGDLNRVAIVETSDEIGVLARTFNSMTSQLRERITALEYQISDRARDRERSAVQLQVAAEVSTAASAYDDPGLLMDYAVQVISNRLNYSHTGIFTIDEAGEFAILRAASSEGGQRMLAQGYKLEVVKDAIVGFVAASGTFHLTQDVCSDATYISNQDLPLPRAELALPMIAKGRIIGVLDVQSARPAAFSDGDITTLQILADQVALVIDNDRLAMGTNNSFQESRTLSTNHVAEAWRKRLGDHKIKYAYRRRGPQSTGHSESRDPNLVAETATINAPIILRGQPLGSITLKKEQGQPGWTDEEIEMVTTVMNQLSLAMESARLIEEARRRIEREQRITEITARITSSTDPEVIMQNAAAELRNILQVNHSQIVLNPAAEIAENATSGNGHKVPIAKPIDIQII